jgi:hypothetical protein
VIVLVKMVADGKDRKHGQKTDDHCKLLLQA